jgi:hypothetical protein
MNINKRLQTILDLFFLVGVFWIVRYWHSRQFGLYEDDLTIIPDAFSRSFSSLIYFISTYITHFSGQGRPLHHSLIYLFSWIGWRTIGLWGPYLIGFLITSINISLFYWLMRRVMNRPFALLAGLGYLLYSADTTQVYLTHSLGLQEATMLILLALNVYLSKKRILAYGLAFLVLFIYETPFLLFLVAPLLKDKWDKALLKEILWHFGILIGLLGLIFIFRTSIGESRVGSLGLKDLIITPILHVLEGPFVSLGTFAYRPYQTIRAFNQETILVTAITFVVFLWFISRLQITTQVKMKDLWNTFKNPLARHDLPEETKSLGRIFITGIIMLAAAYPLTFTVRAFAISGRDTRVHFAGAAGAAIVVASIALLLIFLTNARILRKPVNVLISLELALMAGYGFMIQRDYVLAWQYQREFWTELLPLISDAGAGTIVLVDPAALHDTRQIGANYWNLPRVLSQLYIFPEDKANIPVVYRLESGWQDFLVAEDGQFLINSITVYSVIINEGEYQPANTILIQAENGQLVRRADVELNGQDYQLKPFSEPILPGLPHGFLYPFLITEP